MLVNGNNDKKLRYKRINVVRLVLLIPLSFAFDNRQRTTAVTFSTSNPRHLSFCLFNDNCIVCQWIAPCLCTCLLLLAHCKSNRAWQRWRVHPLICLQCFNITVQYFQTSHGRLSSCFYNSATPSKALCMLTFISSTPHCRWQQGERLIAIATMYMLCSILCNLQ